MTLVKIDGKKQVTETLIKTRQVWYESTSTTTPPPGGVGSTTDPENPVEVLPPNPYIPPVTVHNSVIINSINEFGEKGFRYAIVDQFGKLIRYTSGFIKDEGLSV